MEDYQWAIQGVSVMRLDTGDAIPVDDNDPRWLRVEEWVALGNTIKPVPSTAAEDARIAQLRAEIAAFDFNKSMDDERLAHEAYRTAANAATTVNQLSRAGRDLSQILQRISIDRAQIQKKQANLLNLTEQE